MSRDFKIVSTTATGQGLNQLRNQGHLTDFQIVASGVCFETHRLVLEAASNRFKHLLNPEGTPASNKFKYRIDYGKSFTPSLMEDILNFIYTGMVHITDDNLLGLSQAAVYFKIPDLESWCERAARHIVTEHNCLNLLARNLGRNFGKLPEIIACCTLEHIDRLMYEKEFLELDYEVLLTLLNSRSRVIPSETSLVEAVLHWTNYEDRAETRKKHIDALLDNITFNDTSEEELEKLASSPSIEDTELAHKIAMRLSHISNLKIFAITTDGICTYDRFLSKHIEEGTFPKNSGFTLVILDRYAYLIGGTAGLMRYDVKEKKWRNEVEQPPSRQNHPICVSFNSAIYAFKTEQDQNAPLVYRYTIIEDKWSTIETASPKYINYWTLSAFKHDGDIIAVVYQPSLSGDQAFMSLKRLDRKSKVEIIREYYPTGPDSWQIERFTLAKGFRTGSKIQMLKDNTTKYNPDKFLYRAPTFKLPGVLYSLVPSPTMKVAEKYYDIATERCHLSEWGLMKLKASDNQKCKKWELERVVHFPGKLLQLALYC